LLGTLFFMDVLVPSKLGTYRGGVPGPGDVFALRKKRRREAPFLV
jgi:hypothetical protein